MTALLEIFNLALNQSSPLQYLYSTLTYVAPDSKHLIILTAHKHQLGISGFGISVTTMEEVFIKVGENSIEEVPHVDSRSTVTPLLADSTSTYDTDVTGCLVYNMI